MDRLNLRFVAVGRAFMVLVYHHWSPERSMQVSPPAPPSRLAEHYQWHSHVTDDTWALYVFILFLFFFGWGGGAEGMLP